MIKTAPTHASICNLAASYVKWALIQYVSDLPVALSSSSDISAA